MMPAVNQMVLPADQQQKNEQAYLNVFENVERENQERKERAKQMARQMAFSQ